MKNKNPIVYLKSIKKKIKYYFNKKKKLYLKWCKKNKKNNKTYNFNFFYFHLK